MEVKKTRIFQHRFFFRFLVVLASENHSKIDVFSHFFRKRRFCEICSFPIGKPLFSRFGASKKRPKIDVKTHSKKASQKNVPEIDFGLRFGLPKPLKIDPTSKKSPLENEAQKRGYANQAPDPATHNKSSILGPRRTIQPSFQ